MKMQKISWELEIASAKIGCFALGKCQLGNSENNMRRNENGPGSNGKIAEPRPKCFCP